MKKLFLAIFILIFAAVPAAFADDPIEGREGRAEVRFLEGMIDHHQMALDMANDCLTKAETETVKTLCQNVIDAQSAEIELMRGWLLDWYNIEYTPMSMAGVSHEDHESSESAASGMSMMDMMGMMNMMENMSMSDMMEMMEGMDGEMSMMDMMHGMMEDYEMDMEGMMNMMGEMSMSDMMGMMEMMEHMSMSDMMGMMEGMDGEMSMSDMMHGMMEGGHSQHEQHQQHQQEASPESTDHSQHEQHQGGNVFTDPSMTMGMMAGFSRLEGVEYELAWLEAMIDHHDDALHMAERILGHEGIHAETAEIAQAIIDAQTTEIADMEALIAELGS